MNYVHHLKATVNEAAFETKSFKHFYFEKQIYLYVLIYANSIKDPHFSSFFDKVFFLV